MNKYCIIPSCEICTASPCDSKPSAIFFTSFNYFILPITGIGINIDATTESLLFQILVEIV